MKTLALAFLAAAALSFAQKQFDTPEAAAQALIDAAANNNTAELNAIFGPQAKNLLSSGNPQQDKAERDEFVSIARNKHQLQRDSMNANRMILSIGDQDWPFPVPVVKSNGKWTFDSSMGQLSMKARRIGGNELDAIEICAGFVGAERAYTERHAMQNYAAQVRDLQGLVPAEFIGAAGDQPRAYHGYYFRMLKAQGSSAPGGQYEYAVKGNMIGGFGLVAWPAEYGVTGIHTFIVNQDGVVYEKDLGAASAKTTAPTTQYNPDRSWTPVN